MKWKLIRRIGVGLILLAITSTLFFYQLAPAGYNAVLQAHSNDQTSNQFNMIVAQNNEFLHFTYSCNTYCQEILEISLKISRITANNASEKKIIYSSHLELINQSIKDITLQLGPANYFINTTFQGNSSILLNITSFGVPYKFIITQTVIFFIGAILVIVSTKKKDLLVFKKIITKLYIKKSKNL